MWRYGLPYYIPYTQRHRTTARVSVWWRYTYMRMRMLRNAEKPKDANPWSRWRRGCARKRPYRCGSFYAFCVCVLAFSRNFFQAPTLNLLSAAASVTTSGSLSFTRWIPYAIMITPATLVVATLATRIREQILECRTKPIWSSKKVENLRQKWHILSISLHSQLLSRYNNSTIILL